MRDNIETARGEGRMEGLFEGRMEGCMEGRMEGRMEEKKANALSLKRNGIPVETIAKSLGLTIQEVEAMK